MSFTRALHNANLLSSPPRSIGETVEEVNDSGFNGNVPTLQTQLLADDSMLQVGQAVPAHAGWLAGFCTKTLTITCMRLVPNYSGTTSERLALKPPPPVHPPPTAPLPPRQIYPNGLRHIRPDRRINEWRAPGRKTVQRAATNERQVAIALSGGEVIYFELNPQVGAFRQGCRGAVVFLVRGLGCAGAYASLQATAGPLSQRLHSSS